MLLLRPSFVINKLKMKTKKIILAIVTMIAVSLSSVEAQNNAFGKGDMALNINYGIGTFSEHDFGFSGDWGENVFQNSLGASLEYGIMEGIIKGKGTISVGGQFGYGFGSEDEVDYSRIRIATRGVFHYQFVPQLDTYAGITCGVVDINKCKISVDGFSEDESKAHFIAPNLFAGVRYMLSDSFGLNSEVSWDHFAFWSLGVSFKF